MSFSTTSAALLASTLSPASQDLLAQGIVVGAALWLAARFVQIGRSSGAHGGPACARCEHAPALAGPPASRSTSAGARGIRSNALRVISSRALPRS